MPSTKTKITNAGAKKTSNVKGKKLTRSAVGAPSQHNQSSRKGKRAWRKNVNIEDVEEVLEGMRAEERVVGTTLNKLEDGQLFQIDTKGDERIRNALPPRFSASQLTSTKILAQRSAVAAVFSRATAAPSGSNKRKSVLNREEKDKLMRIAKRPRKGPFNTIMDPSEYASGSGIVDLSEAVKASGTYDPWAPHEVKEIKDGLENVQKKMAKPPVFAQTRDLIQTPAIVEPHQGTSYNPPVDAHQELLEKAASLEVKRLRDAEKMAEVKTKMEEAKLTAEEYDMSVAPGMKVQELHGDREEQPEEDEEVSTSTENMPERKTKVQRNKAARLLVEKRALAEKAQRKRLLASIDDAKSLRKANAQTMSTQEKEREAKLQLLAEKLKKQGLAGQKLGKHKVPETDVVVQLGEDLTESLRGLKPEGNLFRDRFQSLQQRALIEPRVPVIPKRRRNRIIEYEKHAWKNFDRV